MLISELIDLLERQKKQYGDSVVKVRDHQSGTQYPIDYLTFWTKDKVYQIGIKNDVIKEG